MNHETAIAAAFKRAGMDTQADELYNLACEMLRKTNLDRIKCHVAIDRAFEDMCLKKLPGTGHANIEAHVLVAQSRQPYEGEAGQSAIENQLAHAPSPSLLHDGSAGHLANETHTLLARPVVAIPAAPSNLIPVISHIRGKPNRSRGMSAISAIQGIMAKAIIFRLTDGRDIMDAQFGELRGIQRLGIKNARMHTREALVARYLLENCPYANPDPSAKVGDYFPPKTLELAVEAADKQAVAAA